ncbi:MAG: ABC transporter permease subunit [Actinomycetota bacterium]|nr:ABC transporter permease subunit [Actinomycetota bacterium]MDK1016325.1 ABC transporter permease subunit [Actinomycetota bacterium]MDK1026600.1 ABC transporter permease subunit [Actinomycetota bacterium]MDK1095895.1 ABC transporter permease subunit [Actinomycetota bacterium]MDK1102103.1 ABC transporter permease subunit [Actinomycetota bacterium]
MANGSSPQPDEGAEKRRTWRRPLIIAIAILTTFVVYAFAFAKTDVSLDEIQSEQRQTQLFKILRALAKPDLIHYDAESIIVTADVFVPCNGSEPDSVAPDPTGATIEVTPTCASPGEILTVEGAGFEPGKRVIVNFIPRSDFDIFLRQGTTNVADDGAFTLSFEVPSRESEDTQQVQVTTETNIGGWANRVSVWTDTNLNGVDDPSALPLSDAPMSTVVLQLPEFEYRNPGGVTLIDKNNNVLDFISWGGSFEAITGSGTGHVSRDIETDPFNTGPLDSVQLAGSGVSATDFQWVGPEPESFGAINSGQVPTDSSSSLFLNELSFDEIERLEIVGPPGADLSDVKLIFFDGTDGRQYKIVPLADTSDLSPRLSDNALNTWDRIVETVMLALLATTAGTILAVPLSFLAAKNLMRDVKVPVINLSLSLTALPIGLAVGVSASRWARSLQAFADANALTLALALVLLGALSRFLLRWTFPPEDTGEPPGPRLRLLRVAALIAVGFLALIASYVVAGLLVEIGAFFEDLVPAARFLGGFVVKLGEITIIGIPVLSALIGAFAIALAGSKLGYFLDRHLGRRTLNVTTLIVSAIAGATVAIGIGGVVEWFYQLENPLATVVIPAAIGAVFGMFMSLKALRKSESQNIGLTVYYLARTVFNGLRSIEPLVMVIIFVVWVGIGPFAGALALGLHTTAALAKLYSEQVESIANGPLEAVRATGATRVQTIVYAVVPQIVPPYISFTMYRWDINVRMSTIIGFAGGGGIGFLLQQNINLLQYRAAAAQMLAIAIVVATMDYISSRLRERFV